MIATTQKHKYQAYASANQTVAKTQQIIMLYDGTIRLLQQVKEAIAEKRIEDRYHLLIKASSIIQGLQACLDFENGKEIANVLYSFYSTIDTKLFAIHRSNSPEACDEIIQDLKQMRDAWVVVDNAELQAAAPPQPSAQPAAAEPVQPGTPDLSSIILSA